MITKAIPLSLEGIGINGTIACVPCRVINNRDHQDEFCDDELKSSIKITGVERRRFAPPGTTALDLCVFAAQKLAAKGDFDYAAFGGLVFVTMTPDFSMPNNASYAHKLLGFDPNTPAFDLSIACSGYPYGLYVAGMMAQSAGKKILLLDGDTHSPFVSPHDRSTALLFGDGGSATVVGPSACAEPWHFDFVTLGDRESLVVPASGFRNRVTEESLHYREYEDGSRRRDVDLKMDGLGVFYEVSRNAPESIRRVMAAEGKGPDDYDYLLLHQANLMMITQLAKLFGFSGARFPTSIHKYGNIGSASIPLNICSELKDIVRGKQSRVLLSAFGAGFSVASASVSLGPCVCTGVVEYEK